MGDPSRTRLAVGSASERPGPDLGALGPISWNAKYKAQAIGVTAYPQNKDAAALEKLFTVLQHQEKV